MKLQTQGGRECATCGRVIAPSGTASHWALLDVTEHPERLSWLVCPCPECAPAPHEREALFLVHQQCWPEAIIILATAANTRTASPVPGSAETEPVPGMPQAWESARDLATLLVTFPHEMCAVLSALPKLAPARVRFGWQAACLIDQIQSLIQHSPVSPRAFIEVLEQHRPFFGEEAEAAVTELLSAVDPDPVLAQSLTELGKVMQACRQSGVKHGFLKLYGRKFDGAAELEMMLRTDNVAAWADLIKTQPMLLSKPTWELCDLQAEVLAEFRQAGSAAAWIRVRRRLERFSSDSSEAAIKREEAIEAARALTKSLIAAPDWDAMFELLGKDFASNYEASIAVFEEQAEISRLLERFHGNWGSQEFELHAREIRGRMLGEQPGPADPAVVAVNRYLRLRQEGADESVRLALLRSQPELLARSSDRCLVAHIARIRLKNTDQAEDLVELLSALRADRQTVMLDPQSQDSTPRSLAATMERLYEQARAVGRGARALASQTLDLAKSTLQTIRGLGWTTALMQYHVETCHILLVLEQIDLGESLDRVIESTETGLTELDEVADAGAVFSMRTILLDAYTKRRRQDPQNSDIETAICIGEELVSRDGPVTAGPKLDWVLSSLIDAYLVDGAPQTVDRRQRAIELSELGRSRYLGRDSGRWANFTLQLARAVHPPVGVRAGVHDWDDSIRLLREVIEMPESVAALEPDDRCLAIGNLAAQLGSRDAPGDREEAKRYFRQALALADQFNLEALLPNEVGRLNTNLGALLSREFESADMVAGSGLITEITHCFDRGSRLRTAATDAHGHAETLYGYGRFLSARFDRTGDRALLLRAAQLFRSSAEQFERLSSHLLAAEAYSSCGTCSAGLQDWVAGVAAFEKALSEFEQVIDDTQAESERHKFRAQVGLVRANLVHGLVVLGRIAQALAVLDRNLAGELTASLHLRGEQLTDVPEDLRRNLDETLRQLRTAESAVRLAVPGDAGRLWALTEQLRTARQNAAVARHQLDLFKHSQADRFGSTSELGTALEPGTILVAPVVSPYGAFAFVVPSGTAAVGEQHIVPLAGLDQTQLETLLYGEEAAPGPTGILTAYLQQHFAPSPQEHREWLSYWVRNLDAGLGTLWELLGKPVSRKLEELDPRATATVVLLHAGRLTTLPLHAMWYEENGIRHYWSDRRPVVYAPNLVTFGLCCERRRSWGAARDVVAVVDPARTGQPPLEHAPFEAEILSRFGARQILGDQATMPAVLDALGSSRLKLATYIGHAAHSFADPLRSGLVLMDGTVASVADFLGAENFQGIDVLVLSTCESGIADPQLPDYVGLPAAFLKAGVASVVASLWLIDDLAAAMLMRFFYETLLEAEISPSRALALAQRRLREATVEEIMKVTPMGVRERLTTLQASEKPFAGVSYWAGFYVTGAP